VGVEGTPALAVDDLCKRFGDRVAFEGLSFEIGRGEIFGFLGPNGAGKTTTVRTLGTLVAPTSGSALVAGIPLAPENGVEIRRRISIMPEAPGLYLRLSVAENLECFADLYELPESHDRIDRALRAVDLADRVDDPCGTLSKGLRQRVALARTLLSDPKDDRSSRRAPRPVVRHVAHREHARPACRAGQCVRRACGDRRLGRASPWPLRLPRVDQWGRGGAAEAMVNRRRVRAIVRKELREYRRTRAVVLAMATLPLIFIIQPLVAVFLLKSSDATQLSQRHLLLYLLALPALAPAAVAAASIVGERQQGTLEPVLTTPIRRDELVAGKALAPLIPAVAVSYAVYAFFLASAELFAQPGVAPALIRGPDILAQLIFTPLIAGWSIWTAIAISARSSDIRAAQQLSILACLPTQQ
jgi:ABC-type transport system involved in cytochrome c biogenesis ATPase subunit